MDLYSVRKNLSMGIPITDMNIRVTAYARVSTDHLEQQKSLKNQADHFKKYIEENNNWTYIEGYVDDGISGTSDIKRNSFMKMIADAKEGKFDLIITKEISRFSRNTLDSIKYTRMLLDYGVAVFFVDDNINTALPDSELRLTIMSSLAQDEIRRLSSRVKFGMNRAIERGEILGSGILYGYIKDNKTKSLIIVPEEAQIIKKIYELYAIDNYSLSQIAKKLNNEIKDKSWFASTISRIIENPKYKGYYCAKKTEIIDYMSKKIKHHKKSDWVIHEDKLKIPPIISEWLWEKANNKLEDRKKKVKKSSLKSSSIYSNKIYCNNDNCVFYKRKFRRNNKDITWVCSKYLKEGRKKCNSPNIRQCELNNIFKDLINKLEITNEKILSVLLPNYLKSENNHSYEEQIINKRVKSLNKKKKNLLQLVIEGFITTNEFKLENAKVEEELKKIKNKQLKTKNTIGNKKSNMKNIESEIIAEINNFQTLSKTIDLLLKRITVSKLGNGKIELNIYTYIAPKKKIPSLQYDFKRGYDVEKTKKYIVSYYVNYFFC